MPLKVIKYPSPSTARLQQGLLHIDDLQIFSASESKLEGVTNASIHESKDAHKRGWAPESVVHILSGCSALDQSKYLSRYDAAQKVMFYELLYDERLVDEIESENVKAHWDVPIYDDQQEVICSRVDARIVNHK